MFKITYIDRSNISTDVETNITSIGCEVIEKETNKKYKGILHIILREILFSDCVSVKLPNGGMKLECQVNVPDGYLDDVKLEILKEIES